MRDMWEDGRGGLGKPHQPSGTIHRQALERLANNNMT
jgi:hypothetical protein